MVELVNKEIILNLKNYKFLKRYVNKYNYEFVKIGLKIDDNIYYDDEILNSGKYSVKEKVYWFILIITAINIKEKCEKYKYIYDKMCEILDNNVCCLCDFKCDRCIANRLGKSKYLKDGCCYFTSMGFCPYFIDNKCTKKSVSCKLFMCGYIEQKYKFKSIPKSYPLLNLFFNKKQQELLQRSYRKNYEDIIDELIFLSK